MESTRTSMCHRGTGQDISTIYSRALAQMEEREAHNLKVPGSIPGRAMTFFLNSFC